MRKINYALFFALLASLVWSAGAFSQTAVPNPNMWITNGEVRTIVVDGNDTYIGGDFTYVGPQTGYGGKFTTSSSSVDMNYPKVNGGIITAVPDGNGGWYIGGNFTKVGSTTRNYIARIKSDGSLDADWNPNANNIVYTIAFDGTDVYAGGFFTNIGGGSRNRIAKLDKTTGTVNASWTLGANNSVYTIALDGDYVYTGGDFTNIGGQNRNYIAKLSKANGNADPAFLPQANNTVNTIAISGNYIYAGGKFTNIAGSAKQYFAKMNKTNGVNEFIPVSSFNNYVNTIAVSGNDLYVGGDFTQVTYYSSYTRNRIAKISSDALDLNWNPNANGSVNSISVSVEGGNTYIYVGGAFTLFGSFYPGYVVRNCIAKIGTNADNTHKFEDWNPGATGQVNAIALNGSDIYVGGYFRSIGGVTRNRFAKLSNVDGSADLNWNPNLNGSVYTIAVSSGYVYVGGFFSTVGGSSINNLARFSKTTGALDSWNPDVYGTVYSIALNSESSTTYIYIGGSFTKIGGASGITRYKLAKFKESDGSLQSWDPNSSNNNGTVNTIAVYSTSVYVGGEFTKIGSTTRNCIAKIGTSGTGTLDPTWNPNAIDAVFGNPAFVFTIAVDGANNSVYVGGVFNYIGGKAQTSIAKLSTSSTGAADVNWTFSGTNGGSVNTIAISGSSIYVGGFFGAMGGYTRNNIAKLNNPTGAVDVNWNPNINERVNTIAVSGTDIYAGGAYALIGNNVHAFFALFSDRPLPVKLSSFTSKTDNRNVSLKWQTESELNNHGFYVERNNGLGSWEEIGFVKGSGTINTPVNYEFRDKSLTTGKYQYRLKQVDFNGNFEYHTLSGEVEIGVPSKFELGQNYPNPFNPSTKIDFSLPVDSKVSLMVYDISGREVKRIMNNEFTKAGYHTAQFNATGLSSGVYFYRIAAGNNVMSKKMLLIK